MNKLVQHATATYHRLIEHYLPDLARIHAEFIERGFRNNLSFGGRPVFKTLRPNFISHTQYQNIQMICLHLRNAVTKFKDAAMQDQSWMAQCAILDEERELVSIDPGFDRLSITARWDSFMQEDGSIRFVELNAESPAGIAYSDVAVDEYLRLPFMTDFLKKYSVLKWNVRKTLLNELLATYSIFRGRKKRAKPHIAIVDWSDVPTFTEFQLFEEYFRSEGYECTIADPRELSYSNQTLKKGDFEIDLVYKRVLTNDCIQRPQETECLVKACRDLNVCLINPFRAKLVHKKSIFAVLTHERNDRLFTAEEKDIIRRHIPWTRILVPESTRFRGRRIDLIEYVADHKNAFVIKPNDEYGGKGVTIGKESSEAAWQKAIQEALDGEPMVVQEAVELPRMPFPFCENGSLTYQDMVVDLDPYVFGRRVDGVLTRLSASSLANVTAGGGTTPTFVIRPLAGGDHPDDQSIRRTKPKATKKGGMRRRKKSADQPGKEKSEAGRSALNRTPVKRGRRIQSNRRG